MRLGYVDWWPRQQKQNEAKIKDWGSRMSQGGEANRLGASTKIFTYSPIVRWAEAALRSNHHRAGEQSRAQPRSRAADWQQTVVRAPASRAKWVYVAAGHERLGCDEAAEIKPNLRGGSVKVRRGFEDAGTYGCEKKRNGERRPN